MRASFPCTRRLVRHSALTLVLGLGLTTGACKGDDPEPQKLERISPFQRGDAKRPQRDPNTPLRDPSRMAPTGREGEQLDEAGLTQVLAEAQQEAEVGNVAAQRNALRACANKIPADARCDGEMGLAQISAKNRRAAALYYLVEAAHNDDAKAGAELYHRVGLALRAHGKYEEAAAALRLAIAREDSAEIAFELGRTLSLSPTTLPEAADFMAQARVKESRLEWLYEEAVLRGQQRVAEQAVEAVRLFRLYLEQAKLVPATELPAPIDAIEARVAELEALAKRYPKRAEVEAEQATQDEHAEPIEAPATGEAAEAEAPSPPS